MTTTPKSNSIVGNQLGGVLRSLMALAVPILVTWGLADKETLEQITPNMEKLIELFFGVGGVTAVVAATWSAWSNRPKAVIEQASEIEGAIVAVYPSAPPAIKEVAADPKVPGVAPVYSPVGDVLPVQMEVK